MKITESTIKENISKGVLKRDTGMVYATISNEQGKKYVDMTWLGRLPLSKGTLTLSEEIETLKNDNFELEQKINSLENKVAILTRTLESFLSDIENEMKEEF